MKNQIVAVVDFETTYNKTLSVKTMGNSNYAAATDAYLVSIVCPDLGIKFVGRPEDFDWTQLNGVLLVSHNSGFDMAIATALVERGLISDFAPGGWKCSADLCASMGLPRALAKAAKELLDVDMNKAMRDYMKDKTWADAVAEGKAEELEQYALDDSEIAYRIWTELSPAWSEFEQAVSGLNKIMETRGVGINVPLLDEYETKLLQKREELYSLLPWVPDAKPLSKPACVAWCESIGIEPPASFDRTDRKYLAWQRKHADDHAFIAARRDIQNLNKMLATCEKLRERIRPDGRIDASLLYFGAHTGRFSGTGGINLQNIETKEKFGCSMRHLFVPRKDHKFVIVDAAQIEARIMSWVIDDQKMLDQLRNGVGIYEAHARSDMGWQGGNLKQENPELYAQAKVKVLSLNYGCGAERFKNMAEASYGVKMTLEKARVVHADYRARNPKIKQFWDTRNRELKAAAENQTDLEITLPSGRLMRWRDPKIDFNTAYGDVTIKSLDSWGNWMREKTYGGKLTENVIQAIARDILCHHMLEIEARGYEVIMSIHDEVVVEVPEGQAETALDEILFIMSTPPSWANGLPLSAEGSVKDHYDK